MKREGNKSPGNAQRRNKSKNLNSKTERPSGEGTKNFRTGKKKGGNRDSTPSMDHCSLSPESRLAQLS